jgi:enoyl-CoA hydratase/carnithine racemase
MSNSMKQKRVILTIESGIATVTLNRADKHNALDMLMFVEIASVIKRLKQEPKVRVVIVRGSGASFCSGLDVKSVMSNRKNGFKLLWKWWPTQANLAQKVTIGWRKLKVPVIMVLHGNCWGGGMQIALGGDFRIAAPNTSLSIMEAKWGLIPDMGGTVALMEQLPADQAMLLAMTAKSITAKQALELGLISQIEDSPTAAALQLAEQLIERSPDTNRLIKRMYHKIWCDRPGSILAKETFNQWKILLGQNQRIAVKNALGDKKLDFK